MLSIGNKIGFWACNGFMRKSIDIVYRLNGDIDEGINVFELSPILLSVGTLIIEAHKIIFPGKRELSVNIKPFEKGSFDVTVATFAQDMLHQFLNFYNSDPGKDITAVLAYLGFISQFTGINLLELIKIIKGKLKAVEPLESGEVRYVADDNSAYTVANEVHNLYQNNTIQHNIYYGVGKPLQLPGVDSVESFVKHNEEETKVIINKDMAKPIKDYSLAEMPVTSQEEVIENVVTVWVHPIKANLEGGSKSWSFKLGKDETIVANITDENFLARIRNGEIRLAVNDRLLVELLQRQILKGGDITKINEIIKIKEYIKEPEQEKFKFN